MKVTKLRRIPTLLKTILKQGGQKIYNVDLITLFLATGFLPKIEMLLDILCVILTQIKKKNNIKKTICHTISDGSDVKATDSSS